MEIKKGTRTVIIGIIGIIAVHVLLALALLTLPDSLLEMVVSVNTLEKYFFFIIGLIGLILYGKVKAEESKGDIK